MAPDKTYLLKKRITYSTAKVRRPLLTLFKWMFGSAIMGLLVGLIGALFYLAIHSATSYRLANPKATYLMPLAGLVIIGMYHLLHSLKNSGTNLVIKAIQSDEKIPLKVSLLIIISTLITHLVGGSAGKEGAALQIGGSFGNRIADMMHLDERDTKIMIMCGMSACFSSLFGTPMAAAIFSMEVVSVGLMHYAALVPCVLSSLIATSVSTFFDIHPTAFDVSAAPALVLSSGCRTIFLSAFFALGSILFCVVLHKNNDIYEKYLKNPYVRIFIGGLIVLVINLILQTTDYMGAGNELITNSFSTPQEWYVFLLKLMLTSLTLSSGFKGGEIVPSLCIGATLGSFMSSFAGLPTDLCAACGMVGVFCGVTNCPITSLLLSIEMFGTQNVHYYFITIAVSYLLSGYYSLYSSQKITYSKYETKYINRKANK